jgi:hypothetical protein
MWHVKKWYGMYVFNVHGFGMYYHVVIIDIINEHSFK